MELTIKHYKLADIHPADYNPRQDGIIEDQLQASLDEYGLLEPIVVNLRTSDQYPADQRVPTIVGGHQRYYALKNRGVTETDAVVVDLLPTQEKKANLALNKISGDWDTHKLYTLIEELTKAGEDLDATGYSQEDIEEVLSDYNVRYPDKNHGSLAEQFIVPPFSILDTKSGTWQARKNDWKQILGNLAETRENTLADGKFNPIMSAIGDGVSNFDPVLAEVVYKWFAPEKAAILDPFMGEQTKAVVASYLGHNYTGIEIRQEQVETNKAVLQAADLEATIIHADSTTYDYTKLPEYDLVFTCPPYYDLEVYSKDDLSALGTYQEFKEKYAQALTGAISRLKENRFAVLVVGEIRDKKTGFYRNFVQDTIQILQNAGANYYNELILATALASAPLRARNTFTKRKPVKVHQNVILAYKGDPIQKAHEQVLTFYKGNPNIIPEIYGDVYSEDLIVSEVDQ